MPRLLVLRASSLLLAGGLLLVTPLGARAHGPDHRAADDPTAPPSSGIPIYVVPLEPEISTLYCDGSQIEIQSEAHWRFMCNSDPRGRTTLELEQIAHAHDAVLAEGPVLTVDRRIRGAGINIVFNLGGSVPSAAIPAFAAAETYIENLFSDPITVSIDVTFQSLPSGVIGATSSQFVSNVTYATSRSGLISGMDSNDFIQNYLPLGNTIPVRYNGSSSAITNEGFITWTRANYRATVGSTSGTAASMAFNSSMAFDYDPSDGVPGSLISFVDVAIHEVGHALGFVSGADSTTSSYMNALDIFRFQRTDGAFDYNPDTPEEWQVRPRLVDYNTPDDEHCVDVAGSTVDYWMEDGNPWQASHFKEQTPPIGLMDPALANGETRYPNYFSTRDIAVFDAIGYDYPPCEGVTIGTQPASQTIIVGQTAVFTVGASGTAPLTYQWRKAGSNLEDDGRVTGSTTATLTIANVGTLDAGLYDVVINNPCNNPQTSSPAQLTVVRPPSITQHPQSLTRCVGTSASFSVTASGTAPLSYQWRKNGNNLSNGGSISGATTATLTINPVGAGDAASYDCVVTNSYGSATSNTATLTVNIPVTITQHPANVTVTSGSPASFSVTATGSSPAYQWRKNGNNLSNGGNVSGATSATLTINPAGPADAGSYDCVVSNACGSQTSNAATLTVNVAPSFMLHPSPQTICPGGSASFTVAATGTPAPTYRWRKNGSDLSDGGNISGATTATLTINPVGPGDVASYDCVATNAAGSVPSNAAALTVPAGPAITGHPANATAAVGGSASFSVTATGDGLSFRWRKGGNELTDDGRISGALTATLSINPVTLDDAGDYDCVVTNTCGSQTSNAATLTVNSPFITGDTNCDGVVNFDDIDPFVVALSGQPGYEAEYPGCRWLNADCDLDGDVDFDDIDVFVALLGGG